MFGLSERERIYKAIIRATQEEEKHNGKVVSIKELLELSKKRYLKMLEILSPLKEVLSRGIEITNIYFGKNVQGDNGTSIYVEFGDGPMNFFVINLYDESQIDVCLIPPDNIRKLVDDNKSIVLKAFRDNKGYEDEYFLGSASKKFGIDMLSDILTLCDKRTIEKRKHGFCSEPLLDIKYEYKNIGNDGLLVPSINSSSQDVIDLLGNNDNLNNLLENIKIPEANVPYCLKKMM